MPNRLICSLLVLSQLFWLAAPVQAQGLPNFWPSPGTGGYYNGTGGVYVPRLYGGPQYGYSAASRYGMPSNGMGMAVGLGMYGGMMGIGTVMMASQMIARHNMNKRNNPNGQQASSPKDKLAKADRRRSQELKLKGELDSDYQKELAEKGLTPANSAMPGAALSPSSAGGPPMGMGQGAPAFNSAASPPPSMSPAMNPGMSSPAAAQGAPPAEIFNPTPWTPTADQPTF